MRRFGYFVNPYFLFFFLSFHLALGALFCEGANYSNRVVVLSNIINGNTNPFTQLLSAREEYRSQELKRYVGLRPLKEASAMRRLLVIRPAELAKLL